MRQMRYKEENGKYVGCIPFQECDVGPHSCPAHILLTADLGYSFHPFIILTDVSADVK